MSKLRRAWLALGAVALALPLVQAGAPAYAAATTGSISGHLSTDGQVRTDVSVSVMNQDGFFESTNVDFATGEFQFTGLAPGDYQVEFLWGNSGLDQWYHNRGPNEQPDPVHVVAGQDTAVEDDTLPTGTLAGTLTDSGGNPVASASLYAVTANGSSIYGLTDEDGHYSIDAFPGDYTVSFQPQGYPALYVPHTLSQSAASSFAVAVGQTTTVSDQLLATGSVSGRFTTAAGQPAAGWSVSVSTSDGGGPAFAQIDANGNYTIPNVYVGSYQVVFLSPDFNQEQWAYGKLTGADADVFAVTEGANTVVNDSVLPTGTVKVTAKDASSARPIADFCAGTDGDQECSNGTGVVTLTGVRQGADPLYVYTEDGRYFDIVDKTVMVLGNSTTNVAVRLIPGATINTVIKDAKTGTPVANACVATSTGTANTVPEGFGYCSDAQGTIHIGPLDAGTYKLYAAAPGDPGSPYGDQWVGPNGGVGSVAQARATTVQAAKAVTVPPILLDHAGTIAGVVTAPGGQPQKVGVVGVSSFDSGTGPSGPGSFIDATGHYSITGLGPYSWPLLFNGTGGAAQWSGGVADFTKATTVKVTAGATTTYNTTLLAGVTVSGTVRAADGTLETSGMLTAYNAATGDPMGGGVLNSDGTYQLPMLGSQSMKVCVELYSETGVVMHWFGGTDLASATSTAIPAASNLTLNITVS
jgi:hypothetical protein